MQTDDGQRPVKGPRRPVTPLWISSAKDALKTKGVTRTQIAVMCGTSSAYLTQLLQGKYETSTFLDCISRTLEIETSTVTVQTPSLQEIVELASLWDEDMIEQLRVIAQSLDELRKKKG